MAELIKYKVWCNTDGRFEYTDFIEEGKGEPTTCPVDTAHSIDTSKTQVFQTREDNHVVINEEDIVLTHGKVKSICLDEGEIGIEDEWYESSISFPYPVNLFRGQWVDMSYNKGDEVQLVVGNGVLVGAITAQVSVNDTVINVQPTVAQAMDTGYYLEITDGTNTEKIEVLDTDEENNTVTLVGGVVNAYSPVSPTYCKLHTIMADVTLHGTNLLCKAEAKHTAAHIPANTPIAVRYHNRTGGADKLFWCTISYSYGTK